jgi:DNA invertase Pin-like site-specific DNA recombinase
MTRPAIAYTRVSTQRQQRSSPEVQAEQIAAFCAREGLVMSPQVFHEAKSGKLYREQLQAAFDAAIAVKGILVAYDMTRMFRDEIGGLVLMRDLHKRGAAFMTADNAVDTRDQSAAAKLMRTVFLGVAAFQSNQTGEKIALENRKTVDRLGYRTNGAQPFGWRIQKVFDGRGEITDCYRVEVPEEQAVLIQVRELVAENGRTYAQMADVLNSRGVIPPKGDQWTGKGLGQFVRRLQAVKNLPKSC